MLECEECVDDFHILSNSETDKVQRSCMKFNFIEHCIKYDNNPIAIADSSFKCIECEKNYYLNENVCVERTARPDECLEFDLV